MRTHIGIASLILVAASYVSAAETYDIQSNNQLSGPNVFGQTLTAPIADIILEEFTVRLKSGGPATTFDFKVAAWDSANSMIVGAPLYTSATQTAQATADYTDFVFQPNVTLVPG